MGPERHSRAISLPIAPGYSRALVMNWYPRRLDTSCSFARNIGSLVQGYSSGSAMNRFAHAPLMPGDIEGYGVTAQMARCIDRMRVASE